MLRPRPSFAAAPAALLLLLGLAGTSCQTTAKETRPTNSDDIDRSVTLPATFSDVWYRPATKTDFAIPFTYSGTLTVSTERLLFAYDGGSVSVPVPAITAVSWRTMVGDRANEWAAITYMESGAEQQLGFTAANGYRYHTSNKRLYSAIVLAWQAAGGR
jgi:hypothetical protein